MITGQISLLHTSALNSFNFQRFGISSSASPHSPTSENEADENTDSDDKGQGLF